MNLYTFTRSGLVSRFTTARTDVIVGGHDYEARSIKRSRYVLDSVNRKNNITISFPGDDIYARAFVTPTNEVLTVVIATMSAIPFYRGSLVTVGYTPKNMINMTFEPEIRLGSNNMGERRLYQRNCPYELYGRNCKANIKEHAITVNSVVNSKRFKASYDTGDPTNDTQDEPFNVFPTFSDPSKRINLGRFVGGLVIVGFPPFVTRRWITDIKIPVARNRFIDFDVLTFKEHNLKANDIVQLAFGCSRTTSQCLELHDNILNYGGFPNMTKVSPFEGGLRG